jgi:hypothetical protein
MVMCSSTSILSWTIGAALLLGSCSAPQPPLPPDSPWTFDGAQPIPRTVAESVRMLERTLPVDMQVQMRSGSEKDMIRYWDTLGRWIRNNWLMGDQPKPLHEWFKQHYDLHDSEDISWIVLASFWRHINDRPLEVDAQVLERRRRAEARALQTEKLRQQLLSEGV